MASARTIIMAAGEGARMKSRRYKALHEVCGIPAIEYVVRAARAAGVEDIAVVVKQRGGQVEQTLGNGFTYFEQDYSMGKGSAKAVQAAIEFVGDGPVFVLACDMPLIEGETLARVLGAVEDGASAALMVVRLADPTGYGRILRDENANVTGIVEHKDATPEQLAINEVNASVFCFDGNALRRMLARVDNQNMKGEYYLTDTIELLSREGMRVEGIEADAQQGMGINDRLQLAQAEAAMRERINRRHMLAGVTMIDPARTDIGPDVKIGEDTVIYPGCMLSGMTVIGRECEIYPNSRFENAKIGDGVRVESSVLIDCEVGDGTTVGPFAYLRPGSKVGKGCRIGDFVEIKNANLGDITRVSHLAYVGDADVGEDVNISCGVVFGNYDGKIKQRSVVGDRAFVGCNVNLIAPVNIGEGAYIAGGSTINQDVPSGALAIARERQAIREEWADKRRREGKL